MKARYVSITVFAACIAMFFAGSTPPPVYASWPQSVSAIGAYHECGIDYRVYIDPADNFVKVSLKNTCSESTGFTVAVYQSDGSVNRTRRYCYGAGQTGIVTIGTGDWIVKVEIENVTDC